MSYFGILGTLMLAAAQTAMHESKELVGTRNAVGF